MYRILYKERLNPFVTRMDVLAPRIAAKARAGQFIILRVNETGERIPLTIADTSPGQGSVTIIYQPVGATTILLDTLEQGESILDFAGPLGRPTEIEGVRRAAVVGGGVGCAIAYPAAKALLGAGAEVDMIAGFRGSDVIILEREMAAASSRLFVMTDDGSNGNKGFVTLKLAELLAELPNGGKGHDSAYGRAVSPEDACRAGKEQITANGNSRPYNLVLTAGPLPMMRAVAEVTRPYGIYTAASMNPIMIDGTGMCGGCRLTVGGQTKFACVDGPEFDAHSIDWDEAISRLGQYRAEEHECRMRRT